MGQATHRLKSSSEQIEHDIASIRQELGTVLSELEHRRHEFTDWRLQLRRRGPKLVRAAMGVFAAVRTFQKLRQLRRARATWRTPARLER